MKAIICTKYGPPEVLQIRNVEKPAPRKDEVCIKVLAAAVTASDCIIRGFSVPPRMRLPMQLVIGFTRPRQPILGMVLAGEVESTGSSVKSLKAGDYVFGMNISQFGAYAEYVCWRENTLALKPSNITCVEAAAMPYGGLIALSYLKKGKVQAGQKVLIYGASGANGTAAVQLARCLGANVSGVCSTANLEMVESLGAGRVFDYTREDIAGSGETYDFIFDAVGKRKSDHVNFKRLLAPGGKFISVDNGAPRLSLENLNFLTTLIEAGQIKAVIDRTYPLEQIVAAHEYVDRGHKKGNVILSIDHEDK